MRPIILFLAMSILAGCAAGNAASQQHAGQTSVDQKSGFTQAKTQQWFSPDTPETLPPDKIKKLSLGVGGFGGAY